MIERLKAIFSTKPSDFQLSIAFVQYSERMGPDGANVPGNSPKMSGPKPYRPNANGGSKPHPAPFWADWGANFNKQSKAIGDGANKWWANMGVQAKNWKAPKWEMPGTVVMVFLC